MQDRNIIKFRQAKGQNGLTKIGSLIIPSVPSLLAPQELFWTCEKCGLIEPRALPTGRWIRRSCQCEVSARQAQKAEQEHQEWLEQTRLRTYGGWLGSCWEDEDITAEMCSKTFNNFKKEYDPKAYQQAWNYAQNPQGNLLLHGGYGTGKTHLEAAICNYLRETGRLMPDGTRKPMTSLFASAPQFFRAYIDAMNATDKTRFVSLTDQAIGTPLLVIDDVDKNKTTDFKLDTYFLILDERYKAKRPTIISTNKRNELANYLGEAVANSRLMRRLETIEMIGTDYRFEEEI